MRWGSRVRNRLRDSGLRDTAKMCATLCAIFGLERRKPPDIRDDGREGLFTPLPTCWPKQGYQDIVEWTQKAVEKRAIFGSRVWVATDRFDRAITLPLAR